MKHQTPKWYKTHRLQLVDISNKYKYYKIIRSDVTLIVHQKMSKQSFKSQCRKGAEMN